MNLRFSISSSNYDNKSKTVWGTEALLPSVRVAEAVAEGHGVFTCVTSYDVYVGVDVHAFLVVWPAVIISAGITYKRLFLKVLSNRNVFGSCETPRIANSLWVESCNSIRR